MTDGCDSGHLQQLVQRALAGESDRSLKFGRGEGMWLVSLLIVFFHTEIHHSGCHCCAQWSCHAPVLVCRVIFLCLLASGAETRTCQPAALEYLLTC